MTNHRVLDRCVTKRCSEKLSSGEETELARTLAVSPSLKRSVGDQRHQGAWHICGIVRHTHSAAKRNKITPTE